MNQTLFDQILAYVKRHYLPARRRTSASTDAEWTQADVRFFAKGAGFISQGFTALREDLPVQYFNRPEYRSGYLLYFVTANLPKIYHVLQQLELHKKFSSKKSVSILDLGCGPGTAGLACAEYWREKAPKQTLEILGVDQNKAILKDARGLFSALSFPAVQFRATATNVNQHLLSKKLGDSRFDVIILANLINEMGTLEERTELVDKLLQQHCHKDGVLILLEPALQNMSRELMQLRDRLVHSQRTPRERPQILAPCLHDAPCPMLKHNRRDWCHAYLDWDRPDIIRRVDKLIGRRKDYLKYSYLVLSPAQKGKKESPNNTAKKDTAPQLFRMVSSPLKSKGKYEWLLCPESAPHNLLRITRLNKENSLKNKDLDHALRGDLMELPRVERIVEETVVKVKKSFQ